MKPVKNLGDLKNDVLAMSVHAGQPDTDRAVTVHDYNNYGQPISANYRFRDGKWYGVATDQPTATRDFSMYAIWSECLLQPLEGAEKAKVAIVPHTRYISEVNITEVAKKNGKASLGLKQMLERTIVRAHVGQDAFLDRFIEHYREINLNPMASEEAIVTNGSARFKERFEADELTWESFQLGMALLGFTYLTIEGH